MSSGTRVDGAQIRVYTGCGYGNVGTIGRKTFSGSNSPSMSNLTENPYSCSWSSEVSPLLGWYATNSKGAGVVGGNGTFASCGFGGLSGAVWFMDSNDTLQLQSRLLSKIRGSSLNMAVSLAEGKETLEMLKTSSLSVWKAYRSVRRGNFSAAWETLRSGNLYNGRRIPRRLPKSIFSYESSAAWLSMRYGWQPLLSDIFAGLQYIQNREQKKDSNFTRFRASITKSRTTVNADPAFIGSSQVVTNRYSVLVKVNTKYLSSFRDLAACGVLDPELVAWELLPYSFVVDWFLPVGTYLEDRAAIPRIGNMFVFGQKVSGSWNGVVSGSANPGYRVYGDTTCSQKSGSFTRTIGSSWSTPLPSFRNPLAGSWKHVVDAVALWRMRI